MYSVVVPIFNEAGTVVELHQRLTQVMSQLNTPYELIFVDDGSSDDSVQKIELLHPVTLISLRKNFGQTAALDAGIKQAVGDVIITLDGDLQNPPEEIPKLLNYLKVHNLDVVSGWRKKRRDSFLKRFVSRGAYALRSTLLQDGIHDSGCTLKVYRRICFEDVELRGENHRFIPAILKLNGFSIGELPVEHHARQTGYSKYNSSRILKGFVDMLGLWFWRNYSYRPLHLFGGGGLLIMLFGSVLLVCLALARLVWAYPLSTSIWPLVGVFAIIGGLQLFITGLIAEVLAKSYYSEGRRAYTIKTVVRHD